ILKKVDLILQKGKVHVIMGPNGSGKSTLAQVIMGNPSYIVDGGKIIFDSVDLSGKDSFKRSQYGLFLSFQYPPEIPGVSVSGYLRTIYNKRFNQKLSPIKFREILKEKMKLLKMDESFLDRYLNEGFSGGEKKKMEILQLLVLMPKLAILDEVDSGLDIDSIKLVSDAVNYAKKDSDMTILLITHYTRILKYVKPDIVFIQKDGKIIQQGDADLALELEEKGYAPFGD
ncbi:Fe-S cluster assembly ATPase SufC, partial [candidate division WWE3 bacterium RBG_19FT_COMBO_34_6]